MVGDLQSQENGSTDDLQEDSTAHDAANDSDTKPNVPMQKRRRVTRACDECRRKKIKCDGKQPCTHCTVYSYGKLLKLVLVHVLTKLSRLYVRPTLE